MRNNNLLDDGWELKSPRDILLPKISFPVSNGRRMAKIEGNGSEFAMGHFYCDTRAAKGTTYRYYARFKCSEDLDPYLNLIFGVYSDNFNNGIFKFRRDGEWLEGENTFVYNGGEKAEIRVTFRFSARGHVLLDELVFEETKPLPERKGRIAIIKKKQDSLEEWEKVIDYVAHKDKPDLFLLPETFRKTEEFEPIDGPTMGLMSRKAKEYGIYLAGSFHHLDAADNQYYNTGFIVDRHGKLMDRYDKLHLYSPEITDLGMMPGLRSPIFETDFGKVGMIICYDSWFGDLTQLLALKGTELILLPNAGYNAALMPARANDNCTRMATSSMGCRVSFWDTAGRDVFAPDAEETVCAGADDTFEDAVIDNGYENAEIRWATFNFNSNPSAHNWGGPMLSSPGGRRCRGDQRKLIQSQIEEELNRIY